MSQQRADGRLSMRGCEDIRRDSVELEDMEEGRPSVRKVDYRGVTKIMRDR